MIRVIIVDDETRICKLITNLIPWSDLGMEIVGTADNGIAALELIETAKPQLVITDIRMPGYDGLEMIGRAKSLNEHLEFILISGYEEFSYAKQAIEYGVKDYLRKPINKDSLLKALARVQESIQLRARQDRLTKEYRSLQSDIPKIRASFLQTLVLSGPNAFEDTSSTEINQNYHFRFEEGAYRIVCIHLDAYDPAKQNSFGIGHATIEKLELALLDLATDAQSIQVGRDFYLLVNYCRDQEDAILSVFRKALQELKASLGSQGFVVTVGYGEAVPSLGQVSRSLQSAHGAIDERIFKGTGQIIDSPVVQRVSITSDERYFALTKKLAKAVELLHVEKIKQAIDALKEELYLDLRNKQWLSGSELKTLVREIVDTYYITMRNSNIKIADALAERSQWEAAIDNCYSLELLFQELVKGITSSLAKLLEGEAKRNLEQITEAKLYIERNYMENLSLEDLGTHLGFNPTYFSSLFKKETGTSFVEYLIKVRMEKAKDLLKDPDLKVQDVCLMVGYNDVRYFRKLFIQNTGLSPNEYRKILA